MKTFNLICKSLFVCLFLINSLLSIAQAPTTASSNLSFLNIDGNRMRLQFTSGNGAKRIVIAKEGSAVTAVPSDGTDYVPGNFGLGDEIATDEFVVYEGTGNLFFINGLDHSTTYHFRIFEFNGSNFSTQYLTSSFLEGSQATLTNPSVQSSNITFSNVSGSSMTLNWTNGNGDGRLLVAKANAPVDAEPQQLIEYADNSAVGFGNSSFEIGSGNYVLFDSSASSVTIFNLQPGITYHFALFEYNGNSGKVYLNSTTVPSSPGATASQTTETTPSLNTTSMGFTIIDGNRLRISSGASFNKGDGGRRLIVAKAGGNVTGTPSNGIDYAANTTFGNGDTLNADEFIVYNGNSGDFTFITGLQPNTTYHFKVFEYNGTGTNTFYLTSNDVNGNPVFETTQATLSNPTIQASNISFTNVTGTTMTVNWDNGDGQGRILIAKANSAVDVEPLDLSNYSALAGGFGNSIYQIGTANYILYQSAGSSVNVTNLQPGITYHFAIFEYNGNLGKVFLTDNSSPNSASPARANQTTEAFPTLNTTSMGFTNIDGNRLRISSGASFNKGNGARRIIVAKAGGNVTGIPSNGTDYVANTTFGNGDTLNTDEFIVYNGNSGDFTFINGLQPNTTYHFKVFEYNGTGTNTFYLTSNDSNANPVFETSQATLDYPSVNSSNVFFNTKTNTSISLNWTIGDGSNRILIARENEPVNIEPQDLTTYNTLASGFGSAAYEIGTGNYAVYAGNGSSVNVTNLSPGTNYHFALFEYNGSSGKIYLRPGYTFEEQTFGSTPSTQVSNAVFSVLTSTSMVVDFSRGNGSHRLVLVKEGDPVDASPLDLTNYLADNNFGAGEEVGSGNFVVYNNTGEDFQLLSLNPSTTYHFAFFEYAISASGNLYLTPAYTAAQTTAAPPCSVPSNFSAGNAGVSTAELSWDDEISATNGYEYLLITDGSVPNASTTPTSTIDAGQTSFILTGLSANTSYDAYIRSNCDNNNLSDWSTVSSFTTQAPCAGTDYTGNGNTGFGNVIGNSTLSFEDDGITVTGTFTKGPGDFNDAMVIYISNGHAGRNVINAQVNDQGDPLRRAISSAGANASDITFPPGFEATHAIAIDAGFGGLWSIPDTGTVNNGGLQFISAVGNPGSNTTASFTFTFDWADIDLTEKDEFSFLITYLNSGNGFLSDEAIGDGLSAGNPGGDNITFTSARNYPQYFYTFDGTSWSPSDPDGLTEPCRRAFISAGTDVLSGTTTLETIKVGPDAVLDIEANVVSDFIFKSNANGSGQLDDATGSNIIGDATVERYIPAQRAFRFLTPSVTTTSSINANWQEGATNATDNPSPGFGTHITGDGTNGTDLNATGNPSMYTFDYTNANGGTQDDDWIPVTDTENNTFSAGDAYLALIRGDRTINLNINDPTEVETTLRTSGQLSTGNISVPLSTTASHFTLVGNPYQAVVDISQVNSTNMNTSYYWYWDPNLQSEGAYVAVELPNGDAVNPDDLSPSSSVANQFIMPGQSIFLQTLNAGTASVEFTETSKAVNATQTSIFNEENSPAMIDLLLYEAADYTEGKAEKDALRLKFSNDGSNTVNHLDAAKFLNTEESFARQEQNDLMSIESRKLPVDGEILNLYLDNYTSDDYSILARLQQFPEGVSAKLVDGYTGTETELNAGETPIDFSVDQNIPESIAVNRFSLIFENTTLSTTENEFGSDFSLYPNPSRDGRFSIKTPDMSGTVNVEISNLLGQQVFSQNLSVDGQQVNVETEDLSAGVYVVKLSKHEQTFSSKLIID